MGETAIEDEDEDDENTESGHKIEREKAQKWLGEMGVEIPFHQQCFNLSISTSQLSFSPFLAYVLGSDVPLSSIQVINTVSESSFSRVRVS